MRLGATATVVAQIVLAAGGKPAFAAARSFASLASVCSCAVSALAATDAAVTDRPGRWWVDLDAFARRRLAAAGVTRVHGGGPCTISDAGRFYSHRRDGSTGRMASLVWREPAA